MKKYFLVIAVVIMANIILYGVFAFATWELNPKHWDGFLRGISAMFSVVISLLCGAGTYHGTR